MQNCIVILFLQIALIIMATVVTLILGPSGFGGVSDTHPPNVIMQVVILEDLHVRQLSVDALVSENDLGYSDPTRATFECLVLPRLVYS